MGARGSAVRRVVPGESTPSSSPSFFPSSAILLFPHAEWFRSQFLIHPLAVSHFDKRTTIQFCFVEVPHLEEFTPTPTVIEVTIVPAWPCTYPVVDTTGAGDAYIGGLLCGLLGGLPTAAAMTLGSAVAGRKLKYEGARNGLPTRADLIHMLTNEDVEDQSHL
jgi:hypothetical protein